MPKSSRIQHTHIPDTLPCQGPGCTTLVPIGKARRWRLARGVDRAEALFCSQPCFQAARSQRTGPARRQECSYCARLFVLDDYERSRWRHGDRRIRCKDCRTHGRGAAVAVPRPSEHERKAREARAEEVHEIFTAIRRQLLQEMSHD